MFWEKAAQLCMVCDMMVCDETAGPVHASLTGKDIDLSAREVKLTFCSVVSALNQRNVLYDIIRAVL